MSPKHRLSRRQFLLAAGAAAAGTLLALGQQFNRTLRAAAQDITGSYLPLVRKPVFGPTLAPSITPTVTRTAGQTPTTTQTPTPTQTTTPALTVEPGEYDGRVVHIRDADATDWDGSGYFYQAVNQAAVSAMVQRGLQSLTGQSSWSSIWNTLFGRVHPGGYAPGQKIAIKISFNNSGSGGCSSHSNIIDALPEPLIGLIAGMVAAGVQPGDITLYDATYQFTGRIIPDYFRAPILALYPEVHFVGKDDCAGVISPTHGSYPSLTIQFNDPDGFLNDRMLADVLYESTYLINVPIIKAHGISPTSLGYKNHYGSIHKVIGMGNDSLHIHINPKDGNYDPNYNPMVEIYANTHIKDKTVLVLGDGLYGAFGATQPAAVSWKTFNDALNSLFFAVDPVAIDCVMTDFLVEEDKINPVYAYDHLFCAQTAGQGLCEGTRGDPGGNPMQLPYGSGYSTLTYIREDL